jgi:hypothetical protein
VGEEDKERECVCSADDGKENKTTTNQNIKFSRLFVLVPLVVVRLSLSLSLLLLEMADDDLDAILESTALTLAHTSSSAYMTRT